MNSKGDTLNGDKPKAMAKLVRFLTKHTPIGEFRDKFNLEGPPRCHACELNIPKTRDHMVYECRGWTHGHWNCIPNHKFIKELHNKSKHHLQSMEEVVEGHIKFLKGDVKNTSNIRIRDALNFFNEEDQEKALAKFQEYEEL